MFSFIAPVMADDISVSADVGKYISFDCEHTAVSFGSLTQGVSNNAAPNLATGLYNATIDTNYNYKMTAEVNDTIDNYMHNAGNTQKFGIANLTIDLNTVAGNLAEGSSVAVGLKGSPADIATGLSPSESTITMYAGYWLDVPALQQADSYTALIVETYLNE